MLFQSNPTFFIVYHSIRNLVQEIKSVVTEKHGFDERDESISIAIFRDFRLLGF